MDASHALRRGTIDAICCWLIVVAAGAGRRPRWAQVDPQVLEAEAARVEVVERASSSTVAIFARGGQGGRLGRRHLARRLRPVSNFHVTHEAGTAMKCGMADGKLYDAVIVGLDPTGDVALIKLLGRDDFPSAEMADSDEVQVGDWCFAIGNPFLLATDFHPTVSYGIISGVHRYQYPAGTLLEYADCLQADAAINPGNSGGPLFDAQGRLIGINGRGSFEKRGRVNVGVGYAISINQIKNFLGHLKSGRIVDHATLGAASAQRREPPRGRRRHPGRIRRLSPRPALRRRSGQLRRPTGRHRQRIQERAGHLSQGLARAAVVPSPQAKRFDVLVRLPGVHREAELAEMVQGGPKIEPDKGPQAGENRSEDNRSPDAAPSGPHAKPEPMPEIVKQHYIEKPGYVNYYFNELNRDRVWKALVARGDYSAWKDNWTISGETGMGEDLRLEVSDKQASIKLPSGELQHRAGRTIGRPAWSRRAAAGCWWRWPCGGAFWWPGRRTSATCITWARRRSEGATELFDVLVGTHARRRVPLRLRSRQRAAGVAGNVARGRHRSLRAVLQRISRSRGAAAAGPDRSPPRRRVIGRCFTCKQFSFEAPAPDRREMTMAEHELNLDGGHRPGCASRRWHCVAALAAVLRLPCSQPTSRSVTPRRPIRLPK